MLRGWRKNHGEATSRSIDIHTEERNLEEATRASLSIMEDDLEGVESGLGAGTSSYHKLARGMVGFLRAILGFEQDIMKEATERLADAEASANTDHRHAQRSSHAFKSAIYPPGTEYSFCYAETQLMTAVVGVLNESLSESLKGFYKLRKAYQTLDGILAAEVQYEKRRRGLGGNAYAHGSEASVISNKTAPNGIPGGPANGWSSVDSSRPPSRRSLDDQKSRYHALPPSGLSRIDTGIAMGQDSDEDEFFDADEGSAANLNNEYRGKLEVNGLIQDMNKLSLPKGKAAQPPPPNLPSSSHHLIEHDPDSDVFSHPIDVFIHSGANLCFGMLNIMLSMIPPAFSRLLIIIGFHGDRERGIRMLWQASKFHNLNGAMAGLIVLGYYNTFTGMADIIPESDPTVAEDDQVDGYPKQRCEKLLADMRRRHPNSHLWLLEEARLNAFNKRLATAISILDNSSGSNFKQVAALNIFEKALDAMYSHDYKLCSASFISCLTLNNWSHSLYKYIAGCAQVELYRLTQTSDPTTAKKSAAKATELIKDAPQHAGKKKFMARQLPFDIFVTRKVKKWEARAQELGCDLIDAVGVSPIEEMIFFWAGYKRMDEFQLQDSLTRLNWSDSRPSWESESHDEQAVLAVLRAATLRNLGRLEEAEQVLKEGVLNVDRQELKGGLRDGWTAPVAHYEMGVLCWNRKAQTSDREEQERLVKECEGWVDKAAKWESYELDARIGLKIATAQDTLKRWWKRQQS